MKALILAAGYGARLAPITDNLPKALVPVNGVPIIINQINNLYMNDIRDITVVAGYKANILTETLNEKFPGVKIIISENYSSTNNMYSAYLARKEFIGKDFIMMNGDVFFDSSVLQALIKCNFSDAIVVDIGNYIDESMKVIEKNGRLIEISKNIGKELALGSSIDIYKFSAESSIEFFKKCEEYIKNGILKKWSEVALNDILKYCSFYPCSLVGRWFEIDDLKDLNLASEIFK